MKLMTPGIYIIRKKGSFFDSGTHNYLRVTYHGNKRFFSWDGDDPVEVDPDREQDMLESYELVYEFRPSDKIEYSNIEISVSFRDQANRSFNYSFRSWGALIKFIRRFKNLAREIGFFEKDKREK